MVNNQASMSSPPEVWAAVLETLNYIVGEANAPSGLYVQRGGRSELGWAHTGWPNLRCTAVAVGSDAIFLGAGNGVSRWDGAAWRVTTDWRVTEVLDLAIDPFAPSTLLAATAYGVDRTLDAGESWTRLPAPGPHTNATFTSSLVHDVERRGRVLIGTEDGLFESTTGGDAWQALGPRVAVRALRQSLARPSVWLAGTVGHGPLVSHDGGHTWRASAGMPPLYAVALGAPDRMAVGGYRSGVWWSDDGGEQWARASSASADRLDTVSVHALAFDPSSSERLWLGTVGDGVYTHEGGAWHDAGLPETTVSAFAFS